MKSDKSEAQTAIHLQVAAARDGKDPTPSWARLFSGWVVFGERQFLRGYVLLLPDPVVPTLNALGAQERAQFMLDMARLGDCAAEVHQCAAYQLRHPGQSRTGTACPCHSRYADEAPALRTAHPWAYNWQAAPVFDRAEYAELSESLRRELTRMA
ncbi:MAG: hypothetical protein WDM77_08565 [Steroidobacteraceae bacterium]